MIISSRFMLLLMSFTTCLVSCDSTAAASSKALQDWSVSYKLPSGWSLVRADGRLQVFQNDQNTAQLFIAPGISNTIDAVQKDLVALGGSLNLQGQPTENLHETTLSGKKIIKGSYDLVSTATQQSLRGRSITVLSDHNSALGMLVLAQPQSFESASAAMASIVPSVKIGKPKINRQAMAELAGTWNYYAGGSNRISGHSVSTHGHEEAMYFDGQGRYRWNSSSYVSADSLSNNSGGYNTSTGGVSSMGADASQGSYTVIGSQIVITTSNGQKLLFDYQLAGGKLIAGGKTFLRQ